MKDKKENKISGVKWLMIACGACMALGVAYFAFSFTGNAVRNETVIYLPDGAEYKDLMDSLKKADAVRNYGSLHTVGKVFGLQSGVRPGRYRLNKSMSYTDLVRMFKRGLQSPVKVTFNNVRSLPQLAGRLSQQIQPDSVQLAEFLLSDSVYAPYGFTRETFLAMFIPNTYEMYWTVTPRGFTDRMKKEYDRFWNEERRIKAEAIGLSPDEVVVLASIVYEETKMSDEMPVVAGVYVNRLRKKMPLQADPTLKFAAGDFTLRRVLNKHKEIDSPYNTYMYAGLPPGPICMPSVTAIEAVLNYDYHNYLYFCAKPDFSGYHNFAETLVQHNRNRDAWIAAINARGIR